MTATVTLRRYTGSGAGTESSPQSTVELSGADALTGPDVAPGSRSFEAWLRLRVDVAPAVGIANFWVQNTGDLPDGVSLVFGVTDDAATPVDTASLVATKVLTSGQRFVFDAATLSEVGQKSRWLVIQEVATSDAVAGAIPAQALVWGFVER